MTHKYRVSGMTCSSCETKVKTALESLASINQAEVSKDEGSAIIKMQKHLSIKELQKAIGDSYQIKTWQTEQATGQNEQRSWFETYKPIVLIFFYILSITAAIEFSTEFIDFSRWMRHFMAGFFLIFSFFKMLNLKGFKESYLMYDVIARKFPNWGYVYAFTELILGFLFLINFNPLFTNTLTFIIMSISIVGVLQSVLNKKAIKCACLGDIFNLPMSSVTIIEDGLMILMSLGMLLMQL